MMSNNGNIGRLHNKLLIHTLFVHACSNASMQQKPHMVLVD